MLCIIHHREANKEREWQKKNWVRDNQTHTSTNIVDWAVNKIIKFIIHLYYQVGRSVARFVCFVRSVFNCRWEIETGRYFLFLFYYHDYMVWQTHVHTHTHLSLCVYALVVNVYKAKMYAFFSSFVNCDAVSIVQCYSSLKPQLPELNTNRKVKTKGKHNKATT